MNIYFAPLEGITGYLYRTTYEEFFPGVISKYFAPFITTSNSPNISKKELRDILPENNHGINLVPQLLTRKSNEFIDAALLINNLGYEEINLNLGCPSGTVVSKGKGSGMLARPDELDSFLNNIFSRLSIKISVKTRLGFLSRDEFFRLMEIYNQYPIHELIIHPRLRTDMYKNSVDIDMFQYAVKNSRNSLCYNGDIFTLEFGNFIKSKFSNINSIMLGRGLIANPGLSVLFVCGETLCQNTLYEFHNTLLLRYCEYMSGDRNVILKMREIWSYMSVLFDDNKKYLKAIRKSSNLTEYKSAVEGIFEQCKFNPYAGYNI